jgi:hypothetical protein
VVHAERMTTGDQRGLMRPGPFRLARPPREFRLARPLHRQKRPALRSEAVKAGWRYYTSNVSRMWPLGADVARHAAATRQPAYN